MRNEVLDELNHLALLRARDEARRLLASAASAMVETERPARLALVALLAGGHLLLEDVPGVGKTTLARIVSKVIGGYASRIQCNPDVGPTDILGEMVQSDRPGDTSLVFQEGPIFANAVVLDEINRATGRLQAALFEAMEEKYVSVAGKRHPLPKPFFVCATMNPFSGADEHARLSHGQRERFAVSTGIGYPSPKGEFALLQRFGGHDVTADLEPIVSTGDVVRLQQSAARVEVPDTVVRYIVDLVRTTREHPAAAVGASPRAALSLQRCTQALALLEDTPTVTPGQVQELFAPCIAHRLDTRKPGDGKQICEDVLQAVKRPQWDGKQRGEFDLSSIDLPATGIGQDLPTVSSIELRILEKLRRGELAE